MNTWSLWQTLSKDHVKRLVQNVPQADRNAVVRQTYERWLADLGTQANGDEGRRNAILCELVQRGYIYPPPPGEAVHARPLHICANKDRQLNEMPRMPGMLLGGVAATRPPRPPRPVVPRGDGIENPHDLLWKRVWERYTREAPLSARDPGPLSPEDDGRFFRGLAAAVHRALLAPRGLLADVRRFRLVYLDEDLSAADRRLISARETGAPHAALWDVLCSRARRRTDNDDELVVPVHRGLIRRRVAEERPVIVYQGQVLDGTILLQHVSGGDGGTFTRSLREADLLAHVVAFSMVGAAAQEEAEMLGPQGRQHASLPWMALAGITLGYARAQYTNPNV